MYPKPYGVWRSIRPIPHSRSSRSPHLRVSYGWIKTIHHLFSRMSQETLNCSWFPCFPFCNTYQNPPSSFLSFSWPLPPILSVSHVAKLNDLPISWYPLFAFLSTDQQLSPRPQILPTHLLPSLMLLPSHQFQKSFQLPTPIRTSINSYRIESAVGSLYFCFNLLRASQTFHKLLRLLATLLDIL
jgi:hypothetical protein